MGHQHPLGHEEGKIWKIIMVEQTDNTTDWQDDIGFHPIAVGRTPPFLLKRAIRDAPHNHGTNSRDALPESKMYIGSVRL